MITSQARQTPTYLFANRQVRLQSHQLLQLVCSALREVREINVDVEK